MEQRKKAFVRCTLIVLSAILLLFSCESPAVIKSISAQNATGIVFDIDGSSKVFTKGVVTISAQYSDGSTTDVTQEARFIAKKGDLSVSEGTAFTQKGTYSVEVSYGGLKASYQVSVVGKALVKDVVVADTIVFKDDELNKAGITFTYEGRDGATTAMTGSDDGVSITVNGDANPTFPVSVAEGELSISITYDNVTGTGTKTIRPLAAPKSMVLKTPGNLKNEFNTEAAPSEGFTLPASLMVTVTYVDDQENQILKDVDLVSSGALITGAEIKVKKGDAVKSYTSGMDISFDKDTDIGTWTVVVGYKKESAGTVRPTVRGLAFDDTDYMETSYSIVVVKNPVISDIKTVAASQSTYPTLCVGDTLTPSNVSFSYTDKLGATTTDIKGDAAGVSLMVDGSALDASGAVVNASSSIKVTYQGAELTQNLSPRALIKATSITVVPSSVTSQFKYTDTFSQNAVLVDVTYADGQTKQNCSLGVPLTFTSNAFDNDKKFKKIGDTESVTVTGTVPGIRPVRNVVAGDEGGDDIRSASYTIKVTDVLKGFSVTGVKSAYSYFDNVFSITNPSVAEEWAYAGNTTGTAGDVTYKSGNDTLVPGTSKITAAGNVVCTYKGLTEEISATYNDIKSVAFKEPSKVKANVEAMIVGGPITLGDVFDKATFTMEDETTVEKSSSDAFFTLNTPADYSTLPARSAFELSVGVVGKSGMKVSDTTFNVQVVANAYEKSGFADGFEVAAGQSVAVVNPSTYNKTADGESLALIGFYASKIAGDAPDAKMYGVPFVDDTTQEGLPNVYLFVDDEGLKAHNAASKSVTLHPAYANLANAVTADASGVVSALADTDLYYLGLSKNVTELNEDCFKGKALKVLVFEDNATITAFGNRSMAGSSLNYLDIPDSVITIGEASVEQTSALKQLILRGDDTTKQKELKNYAFAHSGVVKIELSNTVIKIGVQAFQDCQKLVEVSFADNMAISEFGNNVFADCIALKSIAMPKTYFKVPSGTFWGASNLEVVTLPACISAIEANAFNGCVSLATINFAGTKVEWTAIIKDSSWDTGTGDYQIVCSDGTLSK